MVLEHEEEKITIHPSQHSQNDTPFKISTEFLHNSIISVAIVTCFNYNFHNLFVAQVTFFENSTFMNTISWYSISYSHNNYGFVNNITRFFLSLLLLLVDHQQFQPSTNRGGEIFKLGRRNVA